MYPTSDAFRAALKRRHRQIIKVEAITSAGTTEILTAEADEGLLEGGVVIDRSASSRRTLTLRVTPKGYDLVPEQAGDLLAPPTRLRVSMGVRFRNGTEELVPVFLGSISRPENNDTETDLTVGVTAFDFARRIRRNRWTAPYAVPAGANVADVLRAAIADRFPGAVFSFATTGSLTPSGVVWGLQAENDPWDDFDKLARADGLELFPSPAGHFVLQPTPDPANGALAATYAEGIEATITGVVKAIDDEPGYNGIIGRSEAPDVSLVSIAWDTDPTSPTYAGVLPDGTDDPDLPEGSDWGKVPRFWTTGLATTQTQLDRAVASILRDNLGGQEQVSFTAVADPALAESDVVQVARARAKVNGRFVVERINLPFGGAVMTVNCRERRV